jgi:hypothetical protein
LLDKFNVELCAPDWLDGFKAFESFLAMPILSTLPSLRKLIRHLNGSHGFQMDLSKVEAGATNKFFREEENYKSSRK